MINMGRFPVAVYPVPDQVVNHLVDLLIEVIRGHYMAPIPLPFAWPCVDGIASAIMRDVADYTLLTLLVTVASIAIADIQIGNTLLMPCLVNCGRDGKQCPQ